MQLNVLHHKPFRIIDIKQKVSTEKKDSNLPCVPLTSRRIKFKLPLLWLLCLLLLSFLFHYFYYFYYYYYSHAFKRSTSQTSISGCESC